MQLGTADADAPRDDSSRPPRPEDYPEEELEQQLDVFKDRAASVEHRKAAMLWLWNFFVARGTPEAFEHVLRMQYMNPLAINGSSLLVLLAGDRAGTYAAELVSSYVREFMPKYMKLLRKLQRLPKSSTGELEKFVTLLHQCLTSRERIITPEMYKNIILNGPSMGEVPEDLVLELLQLALLRKDQKPPVLGIAKWGDYFIFAPAGSAVATEVSATAFIRPFARDILITLGVVMYAYITEQGWDGGRLLRMVETAALEVGNYVKFMPAELRRAAVKDKMATARGTLTPDDYVVKLLQNILSGQVAQQLPEDAAGQQRLRSQVERALQAWAAQNAAKAAAAGPRAGGSGSSSSSLAAAGPAAVGQVVAQMQRTEQQRAAQQQQKRSIRQVTESTVEQLLHLALSPPAAAGGGAGGAAAGAGGAEVAAEGAGVAGAEPMDLA